MDTNKTIVLAPPSDNNNNKAVKNQQGDSPRSTVDKMTTTTTPPPPPPPLPLSSSSSPSGSNKGVNSPQVLLHSRQQQVPPPPPPLPPPPLPRPYDGGGGGAAAAAGSSLGHSNGKRLKAAHRRVNSDDVPRVIVHGQQQQQEPQSQLLHQQQQLQQQKQQLHQQQLLQFQQQYFRPPSPAYGYSPYQQQQQQLYPQQYPSMQQQQQQHPPHHQQYPSMQQQQHHQQQQYPSMQHHQQQHQQQQHRRGRSWSFEQPNVIDPQQQKQGMIQGGVGGSSGGGGSVRRPPAGGGGGGGEGQPLPMGRPGLQHTMSDRDVRNSNKNNINNSNQSINSMTGNPKIYHSRSASATSSYSGAPPAPPARAGANFGPGTTSTTGSSIGVGAGVGPPYLHHHHQRGRRPSRDQRRALTSSSAMPQYGSFWTGGGEVATPPHSPSQQQQQQRAAAAAQVASFSPRHELMGSLAKLSPRLRSKKGDLSNIPAAPGSILRPPSPRSYQYHQHQQQQQVSWSPVGGRHVFNTSSLRGVPVGLQSMFVTNNVNSEQQPNQSSSNSGGIMPARSFGGGGGEAVFAAAGGSGRRHAESSRKMHMRQKSAQNLMADFRGVEQPPACRDVLFLLLFVFHLLGIVYLSDTYSFEALKLHMDDPDSITIHYRHLIVVASCSGAFAVVLSTMLLGFMTFFARRFVQVSLIVVITLSFIWGTVGIGLSPKNIVPITGIIALGLSVVYTIIVWDRTPFAAANLLTALSAVRAHASTVLVALVFQALGLAWSVYFAVLVCGVYDSVQDKSIDITERMAVWFYVFLAISYYWTFQVLSNCVQVVTAGVVGGWWYQDKEGNMVRKSSFKTIFYAMGSICFGSLFVGPVRIVRQVAVIFRPTTDETSLLCLHEFMRCLQTGVSNCVDGLSDRFNPWAFTYIGLYQYGFVDAGQNVSELFEKRGWNTIVSDDLVPNILLLTSLVIGGVTGVFCHLLSELGNLNILAATEQGLVGFGVGTAIGVVVTSILFGLISSSVNAVIVCFATSPFDFEENHAELSHEMRAAWREVWPGALDMVDMNQAMWGDSPNSGHEEFAAFLPY